MAAGPAARPHHVLHFARHEHAATPPPRGQQRRSSPHNDVHVTPAVFIVLWSSCTLAFMLGFSFSSSHIIQVPPFLALFFPDVLRDLVAAGDLLASERGDINRVTHARPNPSRELSVEWCAFSANSLTWFVASRYYVATLCMVFAAWLTRAHGRRAGVWVACVLNLIGTILMASAVHRAQLHTGNVLVGVSLSFLYQSFYLEDAEVAPARYRGAFTSSSVLSSSIGYTAGLGLFWASHLRVSSFGWRLALGLGAWPAVIVLMLLPWLPETPNSLIQRGRLVEGREALRRIRGPFCDIDEELMEIWRSAGSPLHEEAASVSVRQMLLQLRAMRQQVHWVPVLVCALVGFLRENTGKFVMQPVMPAVMASLFAGGGSAFGLWRGGVIQEGANIAGCLIGVVLVDWVGRRPLLIVGSAGSMVAWAGMAAVISHHSTLNSLRSGGLNHLMMALMALMNVSNGLGLQTMFAAVIAESHPLRVRAVAVAISIAVLLGTRGVVTHVIDAGLCALQFRSFILVAVGCLCSVLVAALLLPEMKRVPLERVHTTWEEHWLWGRWCKPKRAPRGGVDPGGYDSSGRSGRGGGRPGPSRQPSKRLETLDSGASSDAHGLRVQRSDSGVSGPASAADLAVFWHQHEWGLRTRGLLGPGQPPLQPQQRGGEASRDAGA